MAKKRTHKTRQPQFCMWMGAEKEIQILCNKGRVRIIITQDSISVDGATLALKVEGDVHVQNYVERATVNIDHVDNLYTEQKHPKKELAASAAAVEEISYTASGLADYVRIPARLDELV